MIIPMENPNQWSQTMLPFTFGDTDRCSLIFTGFNNQIPSIALVYAYIPNYHAERDFDYITKMIRVEKSFEPDLQLETRNSSRNVGFNNSLFDKIIYGMLTMKCPMKIRVWKRGETTLIDMELSVEIIDLEPFIADVSAKKTLIRTKGGELYGRL